MAGAVCALALGCQGPEKSGSPGPMLLNRGGSAKPAKYVDITKVPKHDDIVRIVQFWNPAPWLFDAVNRVVGFKVPTYFVSSETEKGALVSGTVYAWLHVVSRDENGAVVRRTVHMWQLSEDESFLFAARKKAVGGYFYGFILTWPTQLDVAGRTVEIEFGYQRSDGRLVMSSARSFKVPLNPDMRLLPPRRPAPAVPPAPAEAP